MDVFAAMPSWKNPDRVKGISSRYNDDQHKIEHRFDLRVRASLGEKHVERVVCCAEQDTGEQSVLPKSSPAAGLSGPCLGSDAGILANVQVKE